MAKTIYSKSPYFVNCYGTDLVYVDMTVYIYTGTKTTDRPATPSYSLRSSAVNNSVSFEIGSLVNDAIQYAATSGYSTSGAWMDYQVTKYYDDGTTQTTTVEDMVQLYAVDGYTYFQEGSNYDPAKGLTTSVNKITAPSGETVRIPLNKRVLTYVEYFEGDVSADYSATVNVSDDSAQQQIYFNIEDDAIDRFTAETLKGNLFNNGALSNGLVGIDELNGSVTNVGNELVLERTDANEYLASIDLTGLDTSKTYKVTVTPTLSDTGMILDAQFVEDTDPNPKTYSHDKSVFPNDTVTSAEIISQYAITNGMWIAMVSTIDTQPMLESDLINVNNVISANGGPSNYFTYVSASGGNTVAMDNIFDQSSSTQLNTRCSSTFTTSISSGKLQFGLNQVGSVTIDNIYIQEEDYTGNIETYYITRNDDCSYTPVKVKFINRYGAMEDLWFYKRSKLNTSTESQTYQNNQILYNGAYNTYEHQIRKFNVTSKETLTINSGFVSEDLNEAFVQLLQSDKMWITYEGNLLPINIKTSSLSHKTSKDDKLINYELEVEFAFNKINTVR